MSIEKMTEDEFVDLLNYTLSPSSPIRQEELLRGRGGQLGQIRKAISSPGRNIFVHGERGVGKTSLAQTAAFIHHHSYSEPILSVCDQSTDFYNLIKNISSRLLQQNPLEIKSQKSMKAKAGGKYLTLEMAESVEKGTVPLPDSVDEAVGLISYCVETQPGTPVVVIDEFERLKDPKDRELFGDFIKQIGDQSIPAKFIFCGVGTSLSDLLAGHESCFRYLAGIPLERLPWEPRMEIINFAAEKFKISIPRDLVIRIAAISDGFPHYIHLIGTKLFWSIFDESEGIDTIKVSHFSNAIKEAALDVEAHLQSIYKKATEKYDNTYQHILWAVADHPDLRRRSTDIYDSYLKILEQLNEEPIDRTKFNNRMNALKRESHGSILKGSRQGWYEFTESVLRGYSRLLAENADIDLDRDHYLEEARLP